MAGAIAEAYVEVRPDTSGFSRELSSDVDRAVDKSSGRVGAAGKKLGKGLAIGVGLGAVAAGTGFTLFTKKAIGEASDLGESINAVNVTFGDAAEGILALGENAATTVGLSNVEFNSLAVQFSSFAGTIAGEGGDVTATMQDITGRAADFASVMNLEVADAAQIFQSGLAGETEPLKKFGINLSAAAVEAYALENGIAASASEMTEAEKIQARYGLLMEQTAKTQGDFANTSDSLANGMRILKSSATDAAAGFGQALLPGMEAVVQAANDVLPQITGPLNELGSTFADALGPLIDAIIPAILPAVDTLVGLFENFSSVVEAIAPAVGPFVEVLAEIAALVGDSIAAAFEAAAPAIEVLADIFVMVSDVIGDVAPLFVEIATLVGGLVTRAVRSLFPILQQLMPVFMRIATIIGDTLMTVLETLADAFFDIMDALAPLIPVLADAFLAVLEAIAPVIPMIAETIGVLAVQIGEALAPFLAELIPMLAEFLVQLIDMLAPILPQLTDLFLQLIDALLPLLPPILELVEALLPLMIELIETLLPVVVSIAEVFTDYLAAAIEVVVEWFTIVIGWATDFANYLTNNLDGIIAGTGETFSRMGDVFQSIYETVLLPIANFIQDVFTAVVSGFGTAVETMSGVFDTAWGAIQTVYDDVIVPIANFISDVFTLYVNTLKGAFNLLKVGFQSAWNVINSVYENTIVPIADFIKDVFTAAIDGIGTAIETMKGVWDTVWGGLKRAVELAVAGVTLVLGPLWSFIQRILDGIDRIRRFGQSQDITQTDAYFIASGGGGGLAGAAQDQLVVPGVALANGGLFDRPTFSLIGEAGPEAVVPLAGAKRKQRERVLEQAGLLDETRSGGPVMYVENQNIYDGTNADLVAQKVSAALVTRRAA